MQLTKNIPKDFKISNLSRSQMLLSFYQNMSIDEVCAILSFPF